MIPKMLEMLTIRAWPLRPEQRQEGAGHPDHAPEIDLHQPVEILFGDLLESAADGDSGIVEEDVGAAVGGEDRLGEGGDGLAVGDVEPVAADLDAVRAGERRGLGEALLVEVGQSEVAAAPRQGLGGAPADAAGGAGDRRRCGPRPSCRLHLPRRLAAATAAPRGRKRITPSSTEANLRLNMSSA